MDPELWGSLIFGPKMAQFADMRLFSENLLMSLVSFIHAYLHVKIQSQILIYQARFPLDDKWRYLTIIFRRYLTIKTSVIRFTYIKSEFWSFFNILSDSEGKDILFCKRRKRKKWVRELFHKREGKGAFNNLKQKMKLADRENFFR